MNDLAPAAAAGKRKREQTEAAGDAAPMMGGGAAGERQNEGACAPAKDFDVATNLPPAKCFIEPRNLRVLVCDSNKKSRDATCNVLQDCQYNVVAVKTSKQALAKLDEENMKFDLILKEHEPPRSNACRILRNIWKHKVHRSIPVVVLSSKYDSKRIQECLQHGAADYLIKPLRSNEARTLWIRVWTRVIALQIDPFKPPSAGEVMVASPPKLFQRRSSVAGGRPQGSAGRERRDAGALSSSSTSSGSEVDDTSREGSNPQNLNMDGDTLKANGDSQGEREGGRQHDPHGGNGSGNGSGSGVDNNMEGKHMGKRGGKRGEDGPLRENANSGPVDTLRSAREKKGSNDGDAENGAQDKDQYKSSAFQAFAQGAHGSNGNGSGGSGNGHPSANGNGRNAGSNVTGPKHGNGNSNGNTNGHSNGHNGESNGTSARRILPKSPPAQPTPPTAGKVDAGGSPHAALHKGPDGLPTPHFHPRLAPMPHPVAPSMYGAGAPVSMAHSGDSSSMTITPFGPMPSHLAQSMFWGMQHAAQQEMSSYVAAVQYSQSLMSQMGPHGAPGIRPPFGAEANGSAYPMPPQGVKDEIVGGRGPAGRGDLPSNGAAVTNGKPDILPANGKVPLSGSGSKLASDSGARGASSTQTKQTNGSKGEAGSGEQTSAERRAAALDKFRLKRKMLVFSKKIRYASRKQLAEARPRNKGQFVRTSSQSNDTNSTKPASSGGGSGGSGGGAANGKATSGDTAAKRASPTPSPPPPAVAVTHAPANGDTRHVAAPPGEAVAVAEGQK